jgi:hypothetical protein
MRRIDPLEDNWAWGLSLIALTMAVHATGIVIRAIAMLSIRSRVEARSSLRFHHLLAVMTSQTKDGVVQARSRETGRVHKELLNRLAADEVVLFADAVHPTHAVRPVGCWAPKDTPIAVARTSGRQRRNIHGAINPESGQTRMLEVETVASQPLFRGERPEAVRAR